MSLSETMNISHHFHTQQTLANGLLGLMKLAYRNLRTHARFTTLGPRAVITARARPSVVTIFRPDLTLFRSRLRPTLLVRVANLEAPSIPCLASAGQLAIVHRTTRAGNILPPQAWSLHCKLRCSLCPATPRVCNATEIISRSMY